MSTTLQQPAHPRPSARRSRLAVACAAIAIAGGVGAGIAHEGDDPAPGGGRSAALPVPGALTAAERAAVVEALSSRDPRRRRIARDVSAGEAGASALADPGTLHHHGVDTSRSAPERPGDGAARRFHHR